MNSLINNFSEIAPLKKVLMHRPGDEFLNLTPNTLGRLLFDDIPYLKIAQEEHDAYANALRLEGVEVVYLVNLAAEALENGGRMVRRKFLEQYIAEAGVNSLKMRRHCYNYLNSIKETRDMIRKCIAGIDISELKRFVGKETNFYTTREVGKMVIDPIPNLYFQRDPMATIGSGATLHKMWSITRTRESIFMEYVYNYHPFYSDTKLYYDRSEPYCIEGGDIQVLSDEVVAVGISQRTEPDAIAEFAKRLFKDKANHFKYVLAIDIPDERSFMHLDTVMTQVDVDKFAVQDAVMDISTIYEISPGRGGEVEIVEIRQSLHKVLEKYLHLNKVELIRCGNGKRIDAEREQWSDGVNLMCIRPGVVVAYDRNFVTNQTLRKHGIKVIEIPSSELSRGRGGSHCMAMALVREEA